MAQTPAFWCLRSRRDVFFPRQAVRSTLSPALPLYQQEARLTRSSFGDADTKKQVSAPSAGASVISVGGRLNRHQ